MKNSNLSLPGESFRPVSRLVVTLAVVGGLCGGTLLKPLAHAGTDVSIIGLDPNTLSSLSPEDAMAELMSTDEDLKMGQIGVYVISMGLGALSARTAVQQNTIARERSRPHSSTVFDGPTKNIPVPPRNLRDLILKGTVPGDVVRIEYIAGNEATLAEAVEDLRTGRRQWEERLAILKAEKTSLKRALSEAKDEHVGLPLSDQSRGVRSHFLEQIARIEDQLKKMPGAIADAELRLRTAGNQLNTAELNLRSASENHGRKTGGYGYRVVRDIPVDAKTATELDYFFGKHVNVSSKITKKHYTKVPHIRIVRLSTPNAAMASNAARLAKAGAVGFVLSGGLIVHELAVGSIGDRLTKKAATQLSPQARTEPAK